MLTTTETIALHQLATQLRIDSILTSTAAGSGHPSSSMSAAGLMAVLLARHLRYDWAHPDDPRNDHLIFSKGHALLYAMFAAPAVGLAVRGYRPFAATFAAFWSRAYDFIRMAGISQANIRLCGSHAGTEIGPDGPSQMALEDLAALPAIPGSAVLYPADATSTAALIAAMADTSGVVYLRTTRGAALEALADSPHRPRVVQLAVARLPGSGSPDEVMDAAGITAPHIAAAAGRLLDTP